MSFYSLTPENTSYKKPYYIQKNGILRQGNSLSSTQSTPLLVVLIAQINGNTL